MKKLGLFLVLVIVLTAFSACSAKNVEPDDNMDDIKMQLSILTGTDIDDINIIKLGKLGPKTTELKG